MWMHIDGPGTQTMSGFGLELAVGCATVVAALTNCDVEYRAGTVSAE
jgi:hypothetical protein